MMSNSIAERKTDELVEQQPSVPMGMTPDSLSNLSKAYTIFCVDDDLMIRRMLQKTLKDHFDFAITLFENGEDCVQALGLQPDIIILDYWLTEGDEDSSIMNGLDVLEKIKEHSPNSKVIMLSSQNEISIAVDCLKKGASDYLIKDIVMSVNVQKSVTSIIRSCELKHEINSLSQTIKRDKLLIRGYFFLVVFMVIIVCFLLFT